MCKADSIEHTIRYVAAMWRHSGLFLPKSRKPRMGECGGGHMRPRHTRVPIRPLGGPSWRDISTRIRRDTHRLTQMTRAGILTLTSGYLLEVSLYTSSPPPSHGASADPPPTGAAFGPRAQATHNCPPSRPPPYPTAGLGRWPPAPAKSDCSCRASALEKRRSRIPRTDIPEKPESILPPPP